MTKLEYIWVDGTQPTPTLRSKTKVVESLGRHWEDLALLDDCPIWGFDGSSTNQAEGNNSDCALKPVRIYENPLNHSGYLVLCEVRNVDDTPHETNTRQLLESFVASDTNEPWFGVEQEYTFYKDGQPLGWHNGEPPPQGDYYCGRNIGDGIAHYHLDMCIECGIKICGINSEVMLGQWEYQIGAADPLRVSDDLWVARWLMEKICAKKGLTVSLDPKPVEGDWNGAGCHTNFSTKEMREEGGIKFIHEAIDKLGKVHKEHISMYGNGNENRLTGDHETCDIDTFRAGVSDRGASIRIPWQVNKDGKGYLEDRRPASNCDPYLVCWRVLKTVLE